MVELVPMCGPFPLAVKVVLVIVSLSFFYLLWWVLRRG